MDLVTVIQLFRKWAWLILLGGILVGGAAFLWRSRQPDTYQASVTIAVGTSMENPNPDSAFIRSGTDLARTYVVLATTREVLNAAIAAGNLPVTVTYLREHVSAHVIADTPLVVLEVTYTDPVWAANFANAIADQLVINSPSNLTEAEQAQLDLANAEIARLNEELAEARTEFAALDKMLLTATQPDEIIQLRDQRYVLAAIINEKSTTIARYSEIVTGFQQRSNSLEVVEHAHVPSEPIGIGIVPVTVVGAVLGLAVMVLIVLFVDYMDDSIPSATAAAQLLKLPVLTTVQRFRHWRRNPAASLIAYREPNGSATEAYRALRTKLLFLGNGSAQHATYIITSPGKKEGKSVTAANLAVTIALAGLRVLLIDADLRRPTQHRIFGLSNAVGLSSLSVTPPLQLREDNEPFSEPNLEGLMQQTHIPGLRVITSGPQPVNPAELLGSRNMRQWLDQFRMMSEVDIVLIDTPPVLPVADGVTLAMNIDSPLILVIHAHRTRSREAVAAKEQLDVFGTQVLGVILNAAKSKNSYSYQHYQTKKVGV